MKPNEQLLEAINDLDEHLITDALIQPQQPAQRGRKRIRILALAAVLAVCFTACGILSAYGIRNILPVSPKEN